MSSAERDSIRTAEVGCWPSYMYVYTMHRHGCINKQCGVSQKAAAVRASSSIYVRKAKTASRIRKAVETRTEP